MGQLAKCCRFWQGLSCCHTRSTPVRSNSASAARAARSIATFDAERRYTSQDPELRESLMMDWRARRTDVFLSKTVMYGAGVNLQQCDFMIYTGIGFKFADFIQGVHRIYRFGQAGLCSVHLIHTEVERAVLAALMQKWRQHDEMQAKMGDIIRSYGLDRLSMQDSLARTIGVERRAVAGERFAVANSDCVLEAMEHPDNSMGMIITSIPFANHYEWEKIIGKTRVVTVPEKGKKGEKDYKKAYQFHAPDYDLNAEIGLGIRISATLRGETQPRVLELLLVQASVRNSPLWATDPKQQLAYLAVKRWARLYAPDVILGVYTPDELDESNREMRDITPAPAQAATVPHTIDQLPECTDELFAEKTPEWRAIILGKKKTPAQLIAMLSTRATFTEAQKMTIDSWAHEQE